MKDKKRVELLAPAGNRECFFAAIHAGADAVYLAGNRFGARAYADNFIEEELIEAIRYAHLFERKVYMTVNTLLKPDEIKELIPYMIPYYEAGLDGVIVQDMGVFELLKHHFPKLELHCSTQMTLTGPEGASFAQKIGASRIVPARELGIEEIRRIHEAYPDLELECFIHGALCYCYSGQCLFSSMVGGRSGNRGTCAQPCRLPYDVYTGEKMGASLGSEDVLERMTVKREKYPLSLKDLCTIHIIPELIEAGIASFKIEGRMKSAEYVAGVTGIYRDVIDRYYAHPQHFEGPTKKELDILSELYVRSEIEEGYYHHYNGKHMITQDKPSYIGCSEETLHYVRERYMQREEGLPVKLHAVLKKGQPATLSVEAHHKVTVYGEIVEEAKNKPLMESDIRKQLGKTGGTVFCAKQIVVDMDGDIFLPVRCLNELRRAVLDAYQEQLLADSIRVYQKPQDITDHIPDAVREKRNEGSATVCGSYTVSVRTKEQLQICLKDKALTRIYMEDSLWEELFCMDEVSLTEHQEERLYYAVPRILRSNNRERVIRRLQMLLQDCRIRGVYVATPDAYELAFEALSSLGKVPKEHLIAAPFLAVMNRESTLFWQQRFDVLSIPLELSEKELYALWDDLKAEKTVFEMMVYGRIPFMVTANCIRKSFDKGGCSHQSGICFLKDRKRTVIPVVQDCLNCCNTIYNHVPLSLHRHLQKIVRMPHVANLLLSFTTENGEEVRKILEFYHAVRYGEDSKELPFGEYTNGHFTRGVL